MLTNIAEFEHGKKQLRVLPQCQTTTPVSEMLCGNFIEVGFGYQVESMWTEMFFNRSFEKAYPIRQGTYDWFGGNEKGLSNDWTKEEWYHSAYEHNRWYAFPGQDRPQSITPDASYLIERTHGYSMELKLTEGGVHGEHCLLIDNYDDRYTGVAQDGKWIRRGESYDFRGYLQAVGADVEGCEIRLYETSTGPAAQPVACVALETVKAEGGWHDIVLEAGEFEGWATFALVIPGGSKVLADAFSLMPRHSANGWRPDVIEKLRELKPSILRFPGGNFASLHNWKDAIGDRNTRKPEPSIMWGDLNYNDVGTDEFLNLCEQVGTEPLLLINMFHPLKQYYFMGIQGLDTWELSRHGHNITHVLDKEEGIEVARQWVEYCNGDVNTPMGQLRAQNGHPEPYNVKYWEMDNETWRWFTKEEYSEYVIRYAEAMRSVDPDIQIGICSYHVFSEQIEDILELCGHAIDYIADRMCEPFNIKRKIGIVQRYNETHEHQIYYTDTEALQNRPLTLAPFTKAYYDQHNIDFCQSRRTWIYALTMAGNLLHYERYGQLARFMCFNNLCNTSGQSCIEVSKQETIMSASGIMLKTMARTEAAWPLVIEDYEADSLKSIEVQAAWNSDRTKLVVNIVNKCDQDTPISFDLSALGVPFAAWRMLRLSAESGAVQETILSNGHIQEEHVYGSFQPGKPCTFEAKAFSFAEIVLEA